MFARSANMDTFTNTLGTLKGKLSSTVFIHDNGIKALVAIIITITATTLADMLMLCGNTQANKLRVNLTTADTTIAAQKFN